ncbi:MAG: sodium:calcium antiporter, partial [Nanoarchaeota archaeon]
MNTAFLEKKKQQFFGGFLLFVLFMLILISIFSFFSWKWPFVISLFIIGVVLLIEGSDWVVHSATHIARGLSISPVLIGLFFVAVFSSVPELAVILYAAFTGHSSLALGTMIGSVITTLGLVIGLSAMITPISVYSFTVLLEAPFLLLSAVLLFVLSFRLFDFGSSDYVLGKIDGALLLLFFLLFLVYTWHSTVSRESKRVEQEFQYAFGTGMLPIFRTLFVFCVGLVSVFFGAKFVVITSVDIAAGFGINEAIIGLTLVAVATSLPELVLSLVGLFQKEYDLVVGNILGANIITLLFIGGITMLVQPLFVDTHLLFIDMIVLIFFCAMFQVFITTDKKITKVEGGVLFVYAKQAGPDSGP